MDEKGRVVMKEDMLRDLAARRRVLIAAYALTVAAYVTAIVWVVFNMTVSLWIVNFTTLFYVFVVRRLDKKHNETFAKDNLLLTSGSKLEDIQIQRKSKVNQDTVRSLKLFPLRSTGVAVVGGMGMIGRRKQMQVQACEVTICYEPKESGGKKKLEMRGGLWLDVKLAKDSGQHLVLVQKDALDGDASPDFYREQGLEELKLQWRGLQDGFNFYGSPDSTSKTVDLFARSCIDLVERSKKMKGKLLVQVRRDHLCAFVTGRSLVFSTPILKPVTEEILKYDRLPELAAMLEMARTWSDDCTSN